VEDAIRVSSFSSLMNTLFWGEGVQYRAIVEKQLRVRYV
jgi:hypothetical protein